MQVILDPLISVVRRAVGKVKGGKGNVYGCWSTSARRANIAGPNMCRRRDQQRPGGVRRTGIGEKGEGQDTHAATEGLVSR